MVIFNIIKALYYIMSRDQMYCITLLKNVNLYTMCDESCTTAYYGHICKKKKKKKKERKKNNYWPGGGD